MDLGAYPSDGGGWGLSLSGVVDRCRPRDKPNVINVCLSYTTRNEPLVPFQFPRLIEKTTFMTFFIPSTLLSLQKMIHCYVSKKKESDPSIYMKLNKKR